MLCKLIVLFGAFILILGSEKSARRIYRGYKARAGSVPYQAGVAVNLKAGRAVICGGAIIDAEHVLTAGHCVEKGPMSVRVGSNRLDSKLGTWHEVTKYVAVFKNVTQDGTNGKDIAVLEVSPPFKFGKTTKPASLPDGIGARKKPEGGEMIISGWGLTFENSSSLDLLTVKMRMVSEKECLKTWPNGMKDARLCAKGKAPGYGTCGGDSGGPLMQGMTLYGILSYGTDDCNLGKPEVYTKVSAYLSWIKKSLNKLKTSNGESSIELQFEPEHEKESPLKNYRSGFESNGENSKCFSKLFRSKKYRMKKFRRPSRTSLKHVKKYY